MSHATLILLGGLAAVAACNRGPRITITDLGTLPGGTFGMATGINAAGDIVGEATTASGEHHAVLWHAGVLTDLGTLGGRYAQANAINPAGLVVGRVSTSAGSAIAFLWDHGRMINLGIPPGALYSVATGINPAGQIVAATATGLATWDHGAWAALPYPAGATNCAGGAIDDIGRVFGYCTMASNQTRSFMWDRGIPTDLDSRGGGDVVVSRISPAGRAVGGFTTRNGMRPFLWDEGTMTDLTTQGADASFVPTAINRVGLIAGAIRVGHHMLHAALWQRGATLDLGTLPGGTRSFATGINAAGQIVGTSNGVGGQHTYHAVLWTLE